MELTASLAEISALTKANKTKEKWKAGTAMMDLAPAALVKLNGKSAGIVAKLKKNEVCAISFRIFGSMLKESNPKSVLVAALEGAHCRATQCPHCGWSGCCCLCPAARAYAASGGEDGGEEDEEEGEEDENE